MTRKEYKRLVEEAVSDPDPAKRKFHALMDLTPVPPCHQERQWCSSRGDLCVYGRRQCSACGYRPS